MVENSNPKRMAYLQSAAASMAEAFDGRPVRVGAHNLGLGWRTDIKPPNGRRLSRIAKGRFTAANECLAKSPALDEMQVLFLRQPAVLHHREDAPRFWSEDIVEHLEEVG